MPWVTTTVSSTLFSRSPRAERPGRPGRGWAVGLVLVVLLLLWRPTPAAADTPGTEVTQLRLERGDDGVYLSAAVKFELPQGVEDVLDKGIAVYFVAEAEIYRERWYWADRRVAQVARHMRLAYQPLTRRWRVNVSPVSISQFGVGFALNQNFDTLAEALGAIKRVGRLRLGDLADIGDDATHPVVFRFKLDNTQLPRPFQIGVAGHADWNLSIERSVRLPMEPVR